jgi:hypothetical protein
VKPATFFRLAALENAAKLENMLSLATTLAILLRFRARACVVLACLAATLCAANIASANSSVQTKTRVWDFGFAPTLNIRLNALASAEEYRGFSSAQTEHASDSPHAAGAGAGAADDALRAVASEGKLFVYTDDATAAIIQRTQLGLPGRPLYLTPNGNLAPLQAGIELALPARNTATALFQVQITAIESSSVIRIGRVTGNFMGRGGGGVEVVLGGPLPQGAFTRIR